jgi:hypothetical protein
MLGKRTQLGSFLGWSELLTQRKLENDPTHENESMTEGNFPRKFLENVMRGEDEMRMKLVQVWLHSRKDRRQHPLMIPSKKKSNSSLAGQQPALLA